MSECNDKRTVILSLEMTFPKKSHLIIILQKSFFITVCQISKHAVADIILYKYLCKNLCSTLRVCNGDNKINIKEVIIHTTKGQDS